MKHFISLIFYKDVYLVYAYIVILTDAKRFTSGTVLPSLYIHISQTWLLEVCNKIHD